MKKDTLTDHLENYLGKISHGFKIPIEENTHNIQVIELRNGMLSNISAFCTLGMSNYGLSSAVSSKIICQELIVFIPTNFGAQNLPAILFDISKQRLNERLALLRGEVYDHYQGKIFEQFEFTSFYVAPPVCLPDEFAYFKVGEKTINLCWLIPIYKSESAYVKEQGWNNFEDQIIASGIDLFDLKRKPIII